MNVVTSDWITFYQANGNWILEHRRCPSGTQELYAVKEKRELADRKTAETAAAVLASETGAQNVEDWNVIIINQNNDRTFSVLGIRVDGQSDVLKESCANIAEARRTALYYAAERNLNIPFIKPVITKRA